MLHIPQAAQAEISQVLVNGQPVAVSPEGVVELPLTGQIKVTGNFC